VLALAGAARAYTPRWAPPIYAGQLVLDGGGAFEQLAVADFNADGRQDLFTARAMFGPPHNYAVSVALGDGRGHFNDATTAMFAGAVPMTQIARQLVVADFNGDRRPDVFVADHGYDGDPFPGFQNTLVLSVPGGKLIDATGNLPQASDFTHSATAADVDGNGTTDIYVGNVFGQQRIAPRVLLNDGSAHFTIADGALPAQMNDVTADHRYTGSLLADVNGDSAPDLVLAADTATQSSEVLLNDGHGHFAPLAGALPPKPMLGDGLGPAVADLNGDGRADLLIGYSKPGYKGRWVQVLIGNGDGTFRDETAQRLPQHDNDDPWPMFFYPRDFNHDGRGEFGAKFAGDESPVFTQDAAGLLQPVFRLPQRQAPWGFIDSTGDGSDDIAAVNPLSGVVSLYPEVYPGRKTPPKSLPRPAALPVPYLLNLRVRPSRFSGGATISYEDADLGVTTFTIARRLPCKAGRKPRRAKRCIRLVPVAGSFTHNDLRGPNSLAFDGRMGGHRLRPGDYELSAKPTSTNGIAGKAIHSQFRVLP
jgi:hypothetical protein